MWMKLWELWPVNTEYRVLSVCLFFAHYFKAPRVNKLPEKFLSQMSETVHPNRMSASNPLSHFDTMKEAQVRMAHLLCDRLFEDYAVPHPVSCYQAAFHRNYKMLGVLEDENNGNKKSFLSCLGEQNQN